MVMDAARGIEAQTRKLFEVCRLRDIPVITFVNKVDREGRDPFEVLDEIESALALDVCPMTWPVGMGADFYGCYDLAARRFLTSSAGRGGAFDKVVDCRGTDAPVFDALPDHVLTPFRDGDNLASADCPEFAPPPNRE